MNYEEINELNRQTAELTKRIALKWGIIDIVLAVFCLIMIALAVRLIWEGIRERKERMTSSVSFAATFPTVEGYVPVVTDTVQYDRFGMEYHRMGPVGRR